MAGAQGVMIMFVSNVRVWIRWCINLDQFGFTHSAIACIFSGEIW